jgi:hypothetical protein
MACAGTLCAGMSQAGTPCAATPGVGTPCPGTPCVSKHGEGTGYVVWLEQVCSERAYLVLTHTVHLECKVIWADTGLSVIKRYKSKSSFTDLVELYVLSELHLLEVHREVSIKKWKFFYFSVDIQ